MTATLVMQALYEASRPCVRCDRPTCAQRPAPPGMVARTGRGLCRECYEAARHAGQLGRYPRRTRLAADVVEDVEFLSGHGLSREEIAERIGMTVAAMDRAIYRHRARQRAA